VKRLSVVVVGAGFGGLSAAAYLSRAGADVTVVERAAHVGGKAGHLEKDGFVFDAGPTLLTMPEVLEDAFAAAGSSLSAHTTLTRLDPVARYLFANGRELLVSTDHERTKASIRAFAPRDAEAWDAFFAECKEVWEVAGEPYLEAPFDGLLGFTQRALRRGSKVLRLGMSLGTLDQFARRHFESAEMRSFVGRFATYAGGAPARSTAAFAMIPWLEIEKGAFYPRGGMHALAASLAQALARAGVRFRLGTDVREVLLDARGKTVGVATSDRAAPRLAADVVVLNMDPLTAARHLMPRARGAAGFAAKLETRERSLSGLAWSFGVEGHVPVEAHHTVLFPEDYAAEFEAIFERGAMPERPAVYVSVPSLGDRSRAPAGCQTLFTLVNAPATAAYDAAQVREYVLGELERRWCPDLRGRIRAEAVITPADIAATGSAHGSIYGAAPHGATSTFERPKYRADFAEGVYFVGGATHPGGGVPMVTKGGRFVAEAVLEDAARAEKPRAASGLRGWFR